jgi:hypothetical protein
MEISKTLSKMKKDYYSPTPKKWRKLGDALLGVSTTITGFAIMENHKWIAFTALALGVIGKFLTNFFGEE